MGYRILASKASMDSAMKLRDAIEKNLGLRPKTVLVTSESGNCDGHTVLLRYGCGYGSLQTEPIWGQNAFSRLCISKLDFSNTFDGIVRVPKFINRSFPTEFPVLIRTTLTGAQSEGIHVANNQEEFMKIWQPGFFWTKFFKHDAEIRVYAVYEANNLTYKIYKKVPRDRRDSGNDYFITGAAGEDNTQWVLKDNRDYPKVQTILNTMRVRFRASGGVFAGIDMIYVPDLRDYVVLELNSGPWLTLATADWLAKIFIRDQWSRIQMRHLR